MRLTDLVIKTLQPPPKGEKIYPDVLVPGFGVRVCAGWDQELRADPRNTSPTRDPGAVGIIGLQDAREEAKRCLAEYTLGKNAPSSMTWNEALTAFLVEAKRRLKPRTSILTGISSTGISGSAN